MASVRPAPSAKPGIAPAAARPAAATLALTALAMVAFASNSLLCRAALGGGHADPAAFTAVRLAGGAAALGVLARLRRSEPPRAAFAWGSAVVLFAYAAGFSLAYTRIPAGTGALLLFAAVQLTMVGAGLLNGERPRLVEWLGLVLALAGLVVLARPGLARPDPSGAAVMLAAGAAWGLYSLRGRAVGHPIAVNAASFARAAPLGLVLLAGAALAGTFRLDATGAALALASGALASGVGYAIWYAALPGLSAARAATVQLSAPLLAAAGGVLLLAESLTSRLLLAGVLILGGIALAASARQRQPGAAAADRRRDPARAPTV